jgi:predicted ATP-dependent endonuclease of OLD family
MYLEKLIVINYKSCKKVDTDLYKDEPTVLIGINDCGKSTLLRAIDLLLEGKTVFSFMKADKIKNDLSNTRLTSLEFEELLKTYEIPLIQYDEQKAVIIGKFKVEEDDINKDFEESFSLHLIWALEKAKDNFIYLAKVFDEKTQQITDLILTSEAQPDPLSLWLLKDKDLKKIREKNNITDELVANENKAGRFKIIEQIRAVYNNIQTQYTWTKYNDKKKDKAFFPEINYLDWNFSLEELTNFTTSVMNQTIQQNLETSSITANEEAKKAQEKINNNLEDIVQFLKIEIPSITKIKSNVIFNVQHKLTDLVINKDNTDQDIHLDAQGDGAKRQIWFALIKWKAKITLASESKNKKILWCFDEPETHLYPAAQRDFFDKIKLISKGNVQTVISTHSTVFIDRAKMKHIKKVNLIEGYTIIDRCFTSEDIFATLKIRNSDFLFYDKFIVVEGDTEYHLIPYLFQLFSEKSLLDFNIQIVRLDGESKLEENKKSFKNILKEFRKPNEFTTYIFDNDIKIKYDSPTFKEDLIYFIGKQDFEDSIGIKIWEKFVNNKLKEAGQNLIVSNEELQSILDAIPNNKSIPKNQKFYEKLNSIVKQKTNYIEVLPPKGEMLANDLKNYLLSKNDIPIELQKAFTEIIKNIN